MEDSDSASSSSDEDTADLQDAAFATTPTTTPRSYLSSHTASALPTPCSQVLSDNISHHDTTPIFPYKETEFDIDPRDLSESSDIFFNDVSKLFHHQQSEHSRSIENSSRDLNTPCDLTDFLPITDAQGKAGGNFTSSGVGVEIGDKVQGKLAYTLILEDVQPQVVSSILAVLSEAKADIKMKIVNQKYEGGPSLECI